MLIELNVRDIALIREASADFSSGLNILTGETGAGKSVIINAALLALGAKARTDLIRRGAESAYVELVFEVKEQEKLEQLEALGVSVAEDGQLIVSRRITPSRSLSRINGETVTLGQLRDVSGLLIDIYGQNEHQSLKNTDRHLALLDEYLHRDAAELLQEVRESCRLFRAAKKAYERFDLNEKERMREVDLAQFEINEIDEADLREGEEERLVQEHRRLGHARQVIEALGRADQALSQEPVGTALSEAEEALRYDEDVKQIYDQLADADSILQSVRRDISDYVDSFELDEAHFQEIEARLDLIRGLEAKYGSSIDEIRAYRDSRAARLEALENYETQKADAQRALSAARKRLEGAALSLRAKRKEGAKQLCARVREELLELGFAFVQLSLAFTEKEPSENGADEVSFMAALNPGEPMKPLSEAASGGELSRFMLALKTVLAETDDIPTLIFDEIDTGISGRTAQKVSERLSLIGRMHQVICITHLPQIAAMADSHYVIEKEETDGRNVTRIRKLGKEESLDELARLLGGVEITAAVRENAGEMKKLAEEKKRQLV